jgi:endonuclease-3
MMAPTLPYNRFMCAKRDISNELCERIEHVRERLEAHYGTPVLCPSNDPTGELVSTIVSQHTTDASSGKAFDALRRRFPTWSEVQDAPIDEVAEEIRIAGLPMQKARTIQTALHDIDHESLSDLAALPMNDARARLTAIKGVGDKTASCVLLFGLGMPAQPVDTHIERVSKRIGITNDESSATGIQHLFEHCLPADGQVMYVFHVNMVRHGREICQARSPRCGMCVLSNQCDYFAHTKEVVNG